MGVIEVRDEGGGPVERLFGLGPRHRSARDQLQRDRLIELQVAREEHEGRGPPPVYGLELEQPA